MQVDKLNLRILMSTRQYLLYSIAIGLLVLVLILALLIPQFRESYSTYNKLQAEKPNTERLTKKLNALESIPATAEYAQIDIVDKALPSRKPLLELLMSLSTVSQNTGVQISSFDLSPGIVASDSTIATTKKVNKAYESLTVNLEIAGSFKQVQDFIIQVERVSPFTTVTEMQLAGQLDESKAADADQRFTANLTTETYYFTQSIAVRVDTPLPVLATAEQTVLAALAAFAPINVPDQTEVRGGGLDDLFKVSVTNDLQQLQDLLNAQSAAEAEEAATTTPVPVPTPVATPTL